MRHVTVTSHKKGTFQWILDEEGKILDCPYHLRGYWIKRRVDIEKLLGDNPEIIVTCQSTGHKDRILFDEIDIKNTNRTSFPDPEAYMGGLIDIRTA